MKIVLDTNVVVSGLLQARGNPACILSLVLSGATRICHDKRILAEYSEVPARPRFKLDPQRVRNVLSKIKTDGLAIEVGGKFSLSLPDPDDQPFLEVALVAAADFLITGNLADYPPDKCKGCNVISPAAFMAEWQRQAGN
ncbi:MAG: putative toxin-antitoxin system toxin component, PIN family [Verrucomicrobiae bacterium]|nr:putative toxin-antitoxin system toxin component, PIN family [Verrucomicrobiae bacterium]